MKGKLLQIIVSVTLCFTVILVGCRPNHSPKPRGFYRIDFPEKKYQPYNGNCPYFFMYPSYGRVVPDSGPGSEPCWINIEFNEYDGKIHISYKPVTGNLSAFIEDSHTLAYKHTIKADAIHEQLINKPRKKIFGILYNIEGNTASSVQFFITDSTNHFLRGALYFRTRVNKDSLKPVIDFFRRDIIYFIDTFEWK